MTVVKMKKEKAQKKCVIKINFKFEDYRNCLEANQLENKIKHLEKNETDVNHLRKAHKEFMKTMN